MVDWLVIWGVTQAAGLLAGSILKDLAQEGAKDYAKEFFKDCLKNVIRFPEKDVQKEAFGKALKEFLDLFEQELEDADYQEGQIRLYIDPLKAFIERENITTILGSAFEPDRVSLNTEVLAETWRAMNPSPYLPPNFNWENVAKRYRNKVKNIIQNSDKLRPIFLARTEENIARNTSNLAGIAPDYDLKKYAEALQETYGNLRLESLNETGVYYNELKLWKIFVPQNVRECQEFLPQVYEIPKEYIKHLRESGEEIEILSKEELERERQRYFNQQSRSIWEIIGDPTAEQQKRPIQHKVILGDPGSGKSSLLQYLALTWAQRPTSELSLYPLPLLIELRLYGRDKQEGKCDGLLSFIHKGNVTCRLNEHQLHEKLKESSAIALFDGIDEIFDPGLREEVVRDIHRFSNDYPGVQIIVTSRWLGYKGQTLRDAGFRHFMLQELEAGQIQDFIWRWHNLTFRDTDQEDKTRKRDRLNRAIQNSKAIRELAGNPLLLTMMAILNRNQELPRDRPELYNQASRLLLHQWDVERTLEYLPDLKTIDYGDKQAMLRSVAGFMQSSEKGLAGNVIGKEDLEKIIADHLAKMQVSSPLMAARSLIEQLRTRNFILCYLGADSYGFVHRTFLEYFCASEFVWRFEKRQTLTIEGLINEAFHPHWQDENWHEVLRLICGMIDARFAGEIINFLLETDRVARDQDNPQEALGDSGTTKGLENLLLAAICLAEVSDRASSADTSNRLLKGLKNEILRVEKIEFDLESVKPYGRLLNTISTVWQDDQETLPFLKNLASGDGSLYVRWITVRAIGDNYKEDPDTLPFLKNLASGDRDSSVRRVAVRAISDNYKEDPDTLPFLKNLASGDRDSYVREVAVRAIGYNYKEDP